MQWPPEMLTPPYPHVFKSHLLFPIQTPARAPGKAEGGSGVWDPHGVSKPLPSAWPNLRSCGQSVSEPVNARSLTLCLGTLGCHRRHQRLISQPHNVRLPFSYCYYQRLRKKDNLFSCKTRPNCLSNFRPFLHFGTQDGSSVYKQFNFVGKSRKANYKSLTTYTSGSV